ncbi:MAG: hypothetical protein P0116_13375 [Candidatus Nitrosocosmicus sp.]|nr:hypothetical protein [Candidatus Nitrosocosmicus sp.]
MKGNIQTLYLIKEFEQRVRIKNDKIVVFKVIIKDTNDKIVVLERK